MFQIRKHFRKTMLLLAIGILLCGTYSLSDRLKWIDSLFITGLLFLVVAGAVTVWKGGFFRVFVMGFRRQSGRWENDFPATEDSPDSPRERSRSEEHTSELQSRENLVCRLLLEKRNGAAANPLTHDQPQQII